jgi:5-hydroxyisourate hydrolase-like protein (transthyretin family)
MTISRKAVALLSAQILLFSLFGCSNPEPADGGSTEAEHESEPEPIARTEFNDRLENFFEYPPFRAGKPSQFRIHLTDLTDGSPVEKAEVSLTVQRKGAGGAVAQTTAKVGKVAGIYVADLAIPQAGDYDIEFHIRNSKLDERMSLTDFKVE